ncbi:MAG: wax ester/triacylglycerol synthase family O-acyltransferase [Deltaproteobacteria bacterium]|nr:wax ester/triacylglycerol synthase family O-acyltransferase [Deltaproteobacteria bacterium]
MHQLEGSDSIFLALETPDAPGHVGGLTVLDPSDSPDFSFERVCEVVNERMRLEPRYTRKLVEVPFGLDRPYFVEDTDFDVSRHVHRIAVPSPGGIRELAELAGELYRRPLDRDRPLWEMWFIEGAENGRVAMLMKSHHCLMDGMSSAGLGELLCDLEPEPKNGPILPPSQDTPDAEPPSAWDLAWGAARNVATTPARMMNFTGAMLKQTAAAVISSLRDDDAPPLPTQVPATSFNQPVGPRRALAAATLPLADIKAIKKHFDVTVNDVILAITSSAVRRYLEKREELPEESLVAMIAVSTRDEGDDSTGNSVTSAPVRWCTDVKNPLKRLKRIHKHAAKTKEFVKNHDTDMLAGMGEAMPPALTGLLMRANSAGLGMPGNVVVSNVRGTPVPLYVAGAKIECMYPLSLLVSGQGLNITVVSYMDRVDVGFTVDPDQVSDPWALADGIAKGRDELLAAMESELHGGATA